MNGLGSTDEFGITKGFNISAVDTYAEGPFFLIMRGVQSPEPGD
jgi:hypothetical protein